MIEYTENFYKQIQQQAQNAAEIIIPLILDITTPKTVIDIGCGDGTWLNTFQKFGIEEVLGVDGSYVEKKILAIPEENFIAWDLTKPFQLDKKFDLVLSLEVAEHLPVECSELFVETLTNLSPVILFSAAIPGQGGENHINEQWQGFWARLFQKKNYLALDYIRKHVWADERIAYFYRQNMLLFVCEKFVEENNLEQKFSSYRVEESEALSVVHPEKYLEKLNLLKQLSSTFSSQNSKKDFLKSLINHLTN